jgi:hypothetical protein
MAWAGILAVLQLELQRAVETTGSKEAVVG